MTRALNLGKVSTRLQRIGKKAKEAPEQVFTSLAHNIDTHLLWEALCKTRKDGAVGVDGVTWEEYARDWQENLKSLEARFKSGSYKAPPGRRTYIPKGDGKLRPIAIATVEDKILQRAVTMVLNAVYEEDFLDTSYGFRPKRSAHTALKALNESLQETNGGWVLDLDIKGFFDAMKHEVIREFLDRRIRDGVIRRAIDKWLKAGIVEKGTFMRTMEGTPQGGVISPLLANIYLHEVLDKWIVRDVKPRLRGWIRIFRYADDAVLVFQYESDAKRVRAVIDKRFKRFGLEVHPEKTKVVDFRKPRPGQNGVKGTKPGSFDFLSFTFHWARSSKGRWYSKRKTAKKKLKRALGAINEMCRENRHWPLHRQHSALCKKLRGLNSYYGIWGNSEGLKNLRYQACRAWKKWLSRRSQKGYLNWKEFAKLERRYPLPAARLVHKHI